MIRNLRCFAFTLLVFVSIASLYALPNDARHRQQPGTGKSLIRERIGKLRRVAAVLRHEANAPLPKGLPVSEVTTENRYNEWLRTAAERFDNLASDGKNFLSVTKPMQQKEMSFNLQYLQLQAQMQAENRSYAAVSNIMKSKHNTVKNSINNIR